MTGDIDSVRRPVMSCACSTISRSLALLTLLACFSACNVENILPKTAFEAGERSALVSIELVPPSSEDLEGSFDDFRLSIIDVLMHRPADDAWLILNDSETTYSIVESQKNRSNWSAVPIALGDYDAIQIIFDKAQIHAQERWQPAELAINEWTYSESITIKNNVTMQISIRVSDSIAGNSIDGWKVDPKMNLKIQEKGGGDASISKVDSESPQSSENDSGSQDLKESNKNGDS